jgi:7-cyano-7-deazaguanine synthase
MTDKCVVLLSGGLDSTVLLYNLVSTYECYPLTIGYGQRHIRELTAARNVCEARGGDLLKRWKYVELGVLRTLLPSSLTGVGEIPKGHYEDESMKSTVVPNRNMILLSIAGGYASGLGAKYVFYAAHTGDHAIYPDCRPEFIASAAETICLGTGWNNDGVELRAPFNKVSKTDIVKLGKKINVPFYLTWSCYEGRDVHCGVCGTCTERREAFKLAGVEDPTIYIAEFMPK